MSIRAALLVSLVAFTGCQQKPFAEYTSAEGKFKTLFPGEPKVTSTSAAGIVVKMYSVEAWNKAFTIGWSDLSIPKWESEGQTKSRLFDARDDALTAVKGTSSGTTKTILLADRFPGIEFGGTTESKFIRARAYLVGHRMYRVLLIAGSSEMLTAADSEEFFNAFQVLEPESLLPPGLPSSALPEVPEHSHSIESTNGRFTAKYPEKPKKFARKIGTMEFTGYASESAKGTCSVLYSDLPIPGGEPSEKIRERLDAARETAIAETGGTFTGTKDIAIGSGLPGQEFTATVGAKQLRGRVYLVGARLFHVSILGSDEFLGSKEATAFLASFQLK